MNSQQSSVCHIEVEARLYEEKNVLRDIQRRKMKSDTGLLYAQIYCYKSDEKRVTYIRMHYDITRINNMTSAHTGTLWLMNRTRSSIVLGISYPLVSDVIWVSY